MLPHSRLVSPPVSDVRQEPQPPPGPYCSVCRLSLDTPDELRWHRFRSDHAVEVYKLCRGAEYCWCNRCGELVKEAVSWHIRCKRHVKLLPAIYHNIPYYRANPQSLDWHGIQIVTSTGVGSITLDEWNSVDWEIVQRGYYEMHGSFRYHNPGFYDRVSEPTLHEVKEEKDEEKLPPPPYAPPSSNPPIPVADVLNWEDVRGPWTNVWNGGGKPLYAPLDPLSPDGHRVEPEYDDDPKDFPDFPPSYQDESNS